MIGRTLLVLLACCSLSAFAEPLTVTVTNIDGEPAAGAEVFCIRWHDYGCRTEPLPDGARQIADENGRAHFEVEGPEQHILYARQGRFGVHDRYHPTQDHSGGTAAIQLEYARRITGTISGEDGEPLKGVRIMALSTVPLGETDANGRYDIYTMGRYCADEWLYKPGYVASRFSFAFDFSIYNIVLSRGTPITGTVLWSDGAPAANAEVREQYFQAVTDEEGVFALPPVQIARAVSLYAAVRREQQRAVTTNVRVDPYNGEPIELRLPFTEQQALAENAPMPEPPRAYAAGRVTTKDGKPVRAAIVEQWPDGREDTLGQSDKDGRFRVQLSHYEGVYPLAVRPLSPVLCMLGEVKQVKANASEDTVVNFTVTDAAYISGKLQDSAGNPIPNQWVMLRNGSYMIRQSYTTEKGSFAFPNIPITGNPVTVEVRFRGQPRATFVEVPALKPGERRRNVVLKPPSNRSRLRPPAFQPLAAFAAYEKDAQPQPGRAIQLAQANPNVPPESAEPNYVPVRIVVVDRAGEPVPGIHPSFEPHVTPMESGVDGEMVFYHDWVGPVRWELREMYAHQTLYINEYNQNISARQKIGFEKNVLTADSPEQLFDLRIVVDRPEWQAVWGHVKLEGVSGAPKRVAAEVLTPDGSRSRDRFEMRDGWFITNLPSDEPRAIEFQADGYQPRVIAQGYHFEVADGPILVTLPRGPMPKGVAAWTTVTGQPATQAAVDAFPAGHVIRSHEREYYRTAGRSAGPPPDPMQALGQLGAIPQPPFRVRIVDENGDPIPEIYYQGGRGPMGTPMTDVAVPPRLDRPFEFLKGDKGSFTLPVAGVTIWADGKGYVYYPAPLPGAQLPEQLVMADAATLRIRVQGWNGSPVRNAVVGESHWVRMGRNNYGDEFFARTDENGIAVIENWPAGRKLMAAARPLRAGRTCEFEIAVKPGTTLERTVIVGPWPDGSPPATLEQWRNQYQFPVVEMPPRAGWPEPEWMAKRREEREQLLAALSVSDREAISKEVLRQISEAPSITPWARQSNLSFLAGLAVAMDIPEAAAPLKEKLAGYAAGFPNDPRSVGEWTDRARLASLQHVAGAIAVLDDGNPVGYFAELARNVQAAPTTRACAVVVLGHIGTDEAIAAWRALRDEVYKTIGSMSRQAEYTHEEKMTEGLMITIFGIPQMGRAEADPRLRKLTTHGAAVDEDYEYGTIYMGDAYSGGTDFTMRRFGADWVVIWVGSTVIS